MVKEDIEHGEESRVVEDRADWSDEDHERGDCGLREIVEQIVGEDLNGQHRQEGQEDAGLGCARGPEHHMSD